MTRRILATIVCVLVVTGIAVAGDFPRVEVFGGYSLLRLGTDPEGLADQLEAVVPGEFDFSYTTSRFLKKGFTGSAAINIASSFGVVADVRYNEDNFLDFTIEELEGFSTSGSFKWRNVSVMGGPRFTLRSSDRVTPFVHALVGLDHRRLKAEEDVAGSSSGLGVALGGGLDIALHRNVAIRLIQADYYLTRHSGERINNVNLAFGMVFRFGGESRQDRK